MKSKEVAIQLLMSFVSVTAFVTILEGILGLLFMPDVKFGYEAFFSPPLFGVLSSLLGFVTCSKRELTVRQMLLRQILHLVLIEVLVFGLNMMVGNFFEWKLCVSLAISIAIVYLVVNLVLWVNDQRSAVKFNACLKEFQAKQN